MLNEETGHMNVCRLVLHLCRIPIEKLGDMQLEVTMTFYLQMSNRFLQGTIELGAKAFKCTSCSKSYERASDLARHTRQHTNKNKYSCSHCLYVTHLRFKLVHHIKNKHRIYMCNKCEIVSDNIQEFEQHQLSHIKPPTLYCQTHNIHFLSYQSKSQHFKTYHKNIRYTCDICSHYYTTKAILKRHMISHQ